MKVSELVTFLQTQPQDLQVAYQVFSEQQVMEADDIRIAIACEPRPDGWVQDQRPDKPTQTYLLFPGN